MNSDEDLVHEETPPRRHLPSSPFLQLSPDGNTTDLFDLIGVKRTKDAPENLSTRLVRHGPPHPSPKEMAIEDMQIGLKTTVSLSPKVTPTKSGRGTPRKVVKPLEPLEEGGEGAEDVQGGEGDHVHQGGEEKETFSNKV